MTGARLAAAGAFALLAGGQAFADSDPAEKSGPARPPGKVLQTLREIPAAIGRCWSPPSIDGVGEITVKLSFRRDGSILGYPRISYAHAIDEAERRELGQSLAIALAQCGPLPVSPSLGAAIAGRLFAIRFFVTDQKGAHDI
jgi:hypothetical protein